MALYSTLLHVPCALSLSLSLALSLSLTVALLLCSVVLSSHSIYVNAASSCRGDMWLWVYVSVCVCVCVCVCQEGGQRLCLETIPMTFSGFGEPWKVSSQDHLILPSSTISSDSLHHTHTPLTWAEETLHWCRCVCVSVRIEELQPKKINDVSLSFKQS